MNTKDKERVSELVIDEWIWGVFFILSILNITGDEFEKKYCYNHEEKEKEYSKKIFKLTVTASFFIYIYLAQKNCKKYQKLKNTNQDTEIISTRCLASILVVIASFLSLTAQLKDSKPVNPSIL